MTDTRSSTGGKGQPSTANTGTADPNQLAEDFGDLARSLEEHDDPELLLAEIVAGAVAVVPGADEGSISVVTARSGVGSQAPTSDLPAQVDALQEVTGQGPGRVWTRPSSNRPSASLTWRVRTVGRSSPGKPVKPGRRACCRCSCMSKATTSAR
jgi:hypothetical protein